MSKRPGNHEGRGAARRPPRRQSTKLVEAEQPSILQVRTIIYFFTYFILFYVIMKQKLILVPK